MEGELAGENRKNKLRDGVNVFPFKETILSPTLTNRKIKEKTFNHSSRQSLSTILLESGTYLRCFQEFLGHKNSKTAGIHTLHKGKELLSDKYPLDILLKGSDI